jgi:hypothetical protein
MNEISRSTPEKLSAAVPREIRASEEPIGRESFSDNESAFELPIFSSSEEAEAFGREMTRDQFLLCEGAKQSLRELFQYSRSHDGADLNLSAYIAFRIQLYREAQEVAPFPTLVALLRR